mmetsp:Transcript_16140/g.39314  ORF Transcript_16140/g.39314 Transcript_16140/m.39314 type:complete len:378 (+) Transcript_16140:251-1384(+)|eukprot:CAMPEP_0206236108 /NCGR_PEP_ID=MMETSP0047_2-20121206/13526_1 /ASSEMBLY_ACC=CAM_ASM_000192 /TAXON_ID=195065 /ORGANISM="Chroomonas mesostigmatica_cf, Strain CCMP1168" /LENGTH=377 /DNA_ID=CAMNT_0053660395 /DNA_START=224 /DNA_END=1357 /DNA_ORIENTATION=-
MASRSPLIFVLALLALPGCLSFTPLSLPNPFKPTKQGQGVSSPPPSERGAVAVPWFPMSRKDLDLIGTKTLDAGADLDSTHPGFKDIEYRERRKMIVDRASQYRHGSELPSIAYTPAETETWGQVYGSLREASKRHAIEPFNEIIFDLEASGLYGKGAIPQISDVSSYLEDKTGFSLRPVGGLLTPRDFLNGLAFRVFHSTQYIRHQSKPLYTPEPDVVHELVGHAPMLAEPAFAALSQRIGLASLAATDGEIERLATAYWFSVEFGLCMEGGRRKAYGAGLLSSPGELEYACGDGGAARPELRDWDPLSASLQTYPITEYQPVYYVAGSLDDAEARIAEFGDGISQGRPFTMQYDDENACIRTDPGVLRLAKGSEP